MGHKHSPSKLMSTTIARVKMYYYECECGRSGPHAFTKGAAGQEFKLMYGDNRLEELVNDAFPNRKRT